ncbi:MAG TPA: hypothetical protein VK841_04430 [Polyangiaceae bacterium]|nr:hypothetical protein [Polyangiaceae bacterium]
MSAPALSASFDVPRPATRRLLSFTGVFPLGAFLLIHLFLNAFAVRGEGIFSGAVARVQAMPCLPLVEGLLVFLPLLVHASVGLWLVLANRPLTAPSPFTPAVQRAMRTTGIIALFFLTLHLPELRFRAGGVPLDGGALDTLLAYDLSSMSHGVPWYGVAYLVGTAAVVFHFTAGLWGFFAASRRGRASESARRYAVWLAVVLGAGMWLAFADIVVFHATGVGFL